LRKLASAIRKSPAFITQLECEEIAPAIAEDTLVAIADYLELDRDELLVLARRVPREVVPESALELALYRQIKSASDAKKRALFKALGGKAKPK
jgi:transcriptional regulator with XRE-family HTH domain